MSRKDVLWALVVSVIWGGNFTVIKIGLDGIPPMLLAALRYAFTALPAVFLIPKPTLPWRQVAAYGLTIGFGQFACLFYAMTIGMSAGVASLVLQAQVFFTVLFAAGLLKEPVLARQMLGFLVAAIGLVFIGGIHDMDQVSRVPGFALFLTLAAAAFWGISNVIVRLAARDIAAQGGKLDTLSLVTWSSLVPPLPLLAMALLMDTPETLWGALKQIRGLSVFSIAYLAYCGTIFGSAVWSRLLAKYAAGDVAPFSLLVPVSGLILAQVALGERLSPIQWIGSAITLVGLMICNSPFSLKTVRSRS